MTKKKQIQSNRIKSNQIKERKKTHKNADTAWHLITLHCNVAASNLFNNLHHTKIQILK